MKKPNKRKVKEIARRMFIAGKNNLQDNLFDTYFEEVYTEVKEKTQ